MIHVSGQAAGLSVGTCPPPAQAFHHQGASGSQIADVPQFQEAEDEWGFGIADDVRPVPANHGRRSSQRTAKRVAGRFAFLLGKLDLGQGQAGGQRLRGNQGTEGKWIRGRAMAEGGPGANEVALHLEQQALDIGERYLPSCDVRVLRIMRDVVVDPSIQSAKPFRLNVSGRGSGAWFSQELVSQNAEGCSAVGAVDPGRRDDVVRQP